MDEVELHTRKRSRLTFLTGGLVSLLGSLENSRYVLALLPPLALFRRVQVRHPRVPQRPRVTRRRIFASPAACCPFPRWNSTSRCLSSCLYLRYPSILVLILAKCFLSVPALRPRLARFLPRLLHDSRGYKGPGGLRGILNTKRLGVAVPIPKPPRASCRLFQA